MSDLFGTEEDALSLNPQSDVCYEYHVKGNFHHQTGPHEWEHVGEFEIKVMLYPHEYADAIVRRLWERQAYADALAHVDARDEAIGDRVVLAGWWVRASVPNGWKRPTWRA